MKITNIPSILVVISIASGLILGGSSLSFIAMGQSLAQMMGSGMMGNGGMMGSGMMGNGGMMGSGMMGNGGMMGSGMMGNGGMMGSGTVNPNTVTNMTSGTKVPTGINVSIVEDASIMGDKAFQPNPITIEVGNTVRWTNDDTMMHTVTSGSGPNDPNAGKQFNSGFLTEGSSVTHTFKKAGEFNYFCLIHPDMIGKVIAR